MKIFISIIFVIFMMNLTEPFSSTANGKDIEGMVFIKRGCYQMGDTFGDGENDEKPVHEVCVDDFYIGETEVTQRQWTEIMRSNPSNFKGCDDCPVESVSWNDVEEFIKRLNQTTPFNSPFVKGDRGLVPLNKGGLSKNSPLEKGGRGLYRLPTEAEWEYAARSGGKREICRFFQSK